MKYNSVLFDNVRAGNSILSVNLFSRNSKKKIATGMCVLAITVLAGLCILRRLR